MKRILFSLVAIVVAAVLVFGAYTLNTSGSRTTVPVAKPGVVVAPKPVQPVANPTEKQAIDNLKLR